MIFIRGVEVTQAIQYYRAEQHLADPADRGPDNSLTLVAGKAAWVRVYVETDTEGESVGITGSVNALYPISNDRFGAPATALIGQNTQVVLATWQPDYATSRSSLSQTLNYIVPGSVVHGPMVFEINVRDVDSTQHATYSQSILATLQQTLKVRGVMLGYAGLDPNNINNNLVVAAPGLADLQKAAAITLRVYPVSAATFEVATMLTLNTPLTGDASSGQGVHNWAALLAVVATARTADGNKAGYFYYGLLADAFPHSGDQGGIEGGGVASGFAGTFTHELGHYTGRSHAPCGVTPADPNYPAYEPYDSIGARVASIGEYGLDVATGIIPDPNMARDLMSYCGPSWISIYGHKAATNNSALNPQHIGLSAPWYKPYEIIDPWWWLNFRPDPVPYWIDSETIAQFPAPMRKVISIIGTIDSAQRIQVFGVARTEVVSSRLIGVPSEMEAVLHGRRGKELAATRAVEFHVRAWGCGCRETDDRHPVFFQAFLADIAEGSAISIRKEGKTLWRRSAKKGCISIPAPKIRRIEGDRVDISWRPSIPGRAQDTWVRYSVDQGNSWTSAAVYVKGTHTIIDGHDLPAGDLLVEVVIHDGFHSVRSKPAIFRNTDVAPVLAIISPAATVRPRPAGDVLCLWGSIACQPGKSVSDYNFEWRLNGNRIGDELQVFTRVPAKGAHIGEIHVLDRDGKKLAAARVKFTSE
jgi:hypothetical protein